MKHLTRLTLVEIAFICFSVCNIVVPSPLKNLSRLRRPLSRLRRPKKKLPPFLQTAKQVEINCNKKDLLTSLDEPTYSKMGSPGLRGAMDSLNSQIYLVEGAIILLKFYVIGLLVSLAYDTYELTELDDTLKKQLIQSDEK